jgi:Dolichyl-phosphate-mannose-protein mannosyltransferase
LQPRLSDDWMDHMTFPSASSRTGSAPNDWGGAGVDIVLLGAIWLVTTSVVNPSGNFPLNDDWAYAITVRHLIDSGDYHPLENTTMTLITNVIWGALFCLPGGCSFTVLRISTLLASFIGIIGIYLFVRELRQSRIFSLCAALTVTFNPIYFVLSYTFMTDVPFAATAIWATLFLFRNLKTRAPRDLLLGTALALAATLSRQLGICISLAFCLTQLLARRSPGTKALSAMIPALICIGAMLTFIHWLRVTGRLPTLYGIQASGLIKSLTDVNVLIRNLANNAFVASVYIGLFLLPLLLLSPPPLLRTRPPRGYLAVGVGMLAMVAGVASRLQAGQPILMPISSNIVVDSGIGPLTLRDTYLLNLNDVPVLPVGFWYTVTFLALIGGALLVARLIASILDTTAGLLSKNDIGNCELYQLFFFLCAGVYLLPLLASPAIFDRYLIPAMIFFLLGISATPADNSRPASAFRPILMLACAVIGAFSWFSVAGARDYLAWNRLRWTALQELTQRRHVPATEIDGGYEFNGLFLYDRNYDVVARLNDTQKSYWWVHNDTYLIGFGLVPGYEVIEQYTDDSWLGRSRRIVILRKK